MLYSYREFDYNKRIMKKGWIITLVLIVCVLSFHQSVVLSAKTNKPVLLAVFNDTSGDCTNNQHTEGWAKLTSDWKQYYINECINTTNNNSKKWCCVCFEDFLNYPSICSQLFSALTGTPSPTPTNNPTPTNTPTPTPTNTPTPTPTNTPTPIPVHCAMSDWSDCSKTCGGGIKTRQIIRYPNQWGQACGLIKDDCNTQLCSDLGTGGLSNTTSTGQVIILTNIDPTPTPKRLPTPTPEPERFNVIDYYLQAFKQPTPTRIPSPTPKPTIFISNQTPTAVPTTAQSIPTPTLRPESIIPQSLASQTHSIGRTSFTLNTATISEIRIVPNIITKTTSDNEKPFLPQEQKLLAQNVAGAGGGIMVTLQQKTGSQFITRQDELTVKRGNQFFSISNQTETPSTQASQKNTNNSTNSTQIPAEKLEINANNVVAQSSMALSVDPLSGILIVETPSGPQKVSIMPDEALGIVLELKALNNGVPEPSILLVSESGKLMYRIAGTKMEKFLGLLPIAVQKQILVSADTGSIIKIELSLISRILSFFTF